MTEQKENRTQEPKVEEIKAVAEELGEPFPQFVRVFGNDSYPHTEFRIMSRVSARSGF